MRFPLKFALAAVLAKGIVAELPQSSQTHSLNQVHSTPAQAAVKGLQPQKYAEPNFPTQQEAFNQQPDLSNTDEPQYYDVSLVYLNGFEEEFFLNNRIDQTDQKSLKCLVLVIWQDERLQNG